MSRQEDKWISGEKDVKVKESRRNKVEERKKSVKKSPKPDKHTS